MKLKAAGFTASEILKAPTSPRIVLIPAPLIESEIEFKERDMNKKFFFGVVIFFLFGVLMFFFGLVSPRFVGVVTKSPGLVAAKSVGQVGRTPTVARVVDNAVVVRVGENV